MQFLVPPELLGGGGVYPSSATQPGFQESPEQKRKREMLLKAMKGQGSFENIFGTGPGAVTEVTKKPDGTVIQKFASPKTEPIPASEVIKLASGAGNILGEGTNRMAQRADVFSQQLRGTASPQQLTLNQAPQEEQVPQEKSFSGKLGDFFTRPEVYGSLGAIGQAVDPTGFGGRLGAHVQQTARNRAFDEYLQQHLSRAGGGTGSGSPFSSVGLLSPQEQIAATKQPLEDLSALSDAAYKEALASGVETPEQMLQRQVLIEMLGQKQGQPKSGSFQSINVGPDGKRTSPREKHKWLVDPSTGDKVQYIGPDLEAAPSTTGGESTAQERLWYKEAVGEALRQLQIAGYGEIVADPITGEPTGIKWNIPEEKRGIYNTFLLNAIKQFQSLGKIPQGFEKPFEQQATQQSSKPKSSLLK